MAVGRITMPIYRKGSVVQIAQSFASSGEIPQAPAAVRTPIDDHNRIRPMTPPSSADCAREDRGGEARSVEGSLISETRRVLLVALIVALPHPILDE